MIINLSEAKDYLNIDSGVTTYDTILTQLINNAGKEINIICNQEIEETQTKLQISGNGKDLYLLTKFPVNSIDEIKYRSDLLIDFDTSGDLIDSSEYTLIYENSLYYVYYENKFKAGRYNYQITFTHGYTTIPDEIKQVAMEMVHIAFRNTNYKEGTLGLEAQTQNIRSVIHTTKYKNMYREWTNRLRKYRRVVI